MQVDGWVRTIQNLVIIKRQQKETEFVIAI